MSTIFVASSEALNLSKKGPLSLKNERRQLICQVNYYIFYELLTILILKSRPKSYSPPFH